MWISYFNKIELDKMIKRFKLTRLFLILSLLLFAIVFTLLIVFATYDNRALFISIGVITLTLIVWVTIYLIFSLINQSKNIYLYEQVLKGKSNNLKGEICYVSEHSITLQNSTKVFEIRMKVSGSIFNLCLLDLFDKSNFTIGKNVEVDVVSEYIRGVKIDEK